MRLRRARVSAARAPHLHVLGRHGVLAAEEIVVDPIETGARITPGPCMFGSLHREITHLRAACVRVSFGRGPIYRARRRAAIHLTNGCSGYFPIAGGSDVAPSAASSWPAPMRLLCPAMFDASIPSLDTRRLKMRATSPPLSGGVRPGSSAGAGVVG